MKITEFEDCILKLTSNFSMRKLNEEQYEQIFNRFSYLSDGRFAKLTIYLTDSYTKKDFDFSIKAFKNALKEIPREEKSSDDAESCGRTGCHHGWITYIKHVRDYPYEYAARCSCPAGDELSSSIARYDDLFPGGYYAD